jgi:predicted HTH transcriptional regulator
LSDKLQIQKLIEDPHEALNVEIKQWLDFDDIACKVKVARAIMALANYGGGFLLLGFKEKSFDNFAPDFENLIYHKKWSQDNLNGLAAAYMYPVFHIETESYKVGNEKCEVLAVIVSGNHKVPIQCIKGSPDGKGLISGKYYTRRPGPKSAEPDTPEDWNRIVTNCIRSSKDELLDTIRLIVGEPISIPKGEDVKFKSQLDDLVKQAETIMIGGAQ